MKLVETIPCNAGARIRQRRRRLWFVAALALFVALTAAFPMGVYMVLAMPILAPTLLVQGNTGGHWAVAIPLGVLAALATLLIIYLATVWLTPRKSTVLYLRRFRLSAASQAMSEAIEAGVGRRYRVLTLDDATFKPLEVPPLERWISRYGSPFTLVGALALVLLVLWFGAQFLSFSMDGLFAIFYAIVGGLFTFVLPIAGPALFFWLLFLVPAFLLHRSRVKQRSRLTITSAEELSAALQYGLTLSGRLRGPAFLAPQATVVKVVDAFWQQAVIGLAEQASAILIDLSAPTVHVLWEIETAIRDFRSKIIYIGQGPMVEQWMSATGDGDEVELRAAILALLGDATVLAYAPESRASRRKFRRSLRNALDDLDIQSPPYFDVPASWQGLAIGQQSLLPPFWKAIRLYAAIGALSVPMSIVLWNIVSKVAAMAIGHAAAQ